MEYSIGDRVRVKSRAWFDDNKNNIDEVECGNTVFIPDMEKYCGTIVTISNTYKHINCYNIKEDGKQHYWTDEMFEGPVKQKQLPAPKFDVGSFVYLPHVNKPLKIINRCYDDHWRYKIDSIEDNEYWFYEKELKAVEESACQKCVFAVQDDNPHCGLRGFRSNFNVKHCSAENDKMPNGFELQEDGYFSWVNKKKEYPKTYEECCFFLHEYPTQPNITGYKYKLLHTFRKLLICRDAYWNLYGEEMGLGKSWKPDWNNISDKYCIYFVSGDVWSKECQTRQCPFAFPTPEMRDAFKENFDKDIEFCKELL